jgi:phosphatidylglycerol---prolipoprotein diacylglyceryl transferase
MIPYITAGPIDFGPVRIHPFGITVACALLTWLALILGRAGKLGLDRWRALRLFECILAAGVAGAVLYGLLLTRIAPGSRMGYAGFGGAFGALAGAWAYFRLQGMKPEWRWRYLDLLGYAFPFGWAFLRLGCTLVHEHPGRLSSSWLAVAYPGGARYDLGFLEMLLSVVVAGAFLVLAREPRPPGFFFGWIVLCGPARMAMNLLRENQPRVLGVTADLAAGLFLTGLGVWLVLRARKQARGPRVPTF